jgi:hypothetical protein
VVRRLVAGLRGDRTARAVATPIRDALPPGATCRGVFDRPNLSHGSIAVVRRWRRQPRRRSPLYLGLRPGLGATISMARQTKPCANSKLLGNYLKIRLRGVQRGCPSGPDSSGGDVSQAPKPVRAGGCRAGAQIEIVARRIAIGKMTEAHRPVPPRVVTPLMKKGTAT